MKGIFGDFRFQEDEDKLVRMTRSELQPKAASGGRIFNLELIPDDCSGRGESLRIDDISTTQSWPPFGGFCPIESCKYLSFECSFIIVLTMEEGGSGRGGPGP